MSKRAKRSRCRAISSSDASSGISARKKRSPICFRNSRSSSVTRKLTRCEILMFAGSNSSMTLRGFAAPRAGRAASAAALAATGSFRRLRRLWLIRCSQSEHNPQAELDIARRAHRARNRSGHIRADVGIRQVELRMVENVEELRAELQPDALGDREFLEDREIDIGAAGRAKDAAAGVAERVQRGRGPGHAGRIQGGIEPAGKSRVVDAGIPYPIGTASGSGI